MGSEDGDDQDNYPDGNLSVCINPLMSSDFWLLSGEEEEEQEMDAMMGELTNEELKAAFRSVIELDLDPCNNDSFTCVWRIFDDVGEGFISVERFRVSCQSSCRTFLAPWRAQGVTISVRACLLFIFHAQNGSLMLSWKLYQAVS